MISKSDLYKLIAGAAVLMVLTGLLLWTLRSIYNAGFLAGQGSIEKAWSQQTADLEARNQALTLKVASLQRSVDTQALAFERTSHEEKQAIIDDYERRMSAVRSGIRRVYIAAKCPALPAADNPARAATAGLVAGHGQARAELDPQVVADLTGIARDGDTCIVQLNEMIDRYHAAQAALAQLQHQQGTSP